MGSATPPSAQPTLDISRRIAADRYLQREIDKSIESLSATRVPVAGTRVARMLATVLEPAWAEHASFQDEVLFPLLARRTEAPELSLLLDRLGGEHSAIAEHHRLVSAGLTSFLSGRHQNDGRFHTCLRATLELRQRHYAAEAALERLVGAHLDSADCDRLITWRDTRKASAFPVSLILDCWD